MPKPVSNPFLQQCHAQHYCYLPQKNIPVYCPNINYNILQRLNISLSAIFFTLFLQQIYYRIILSINCAKLQQCLGILYPLTAICLVSMPPVSFVRSLRFISFSCLRKREFFRYFRKQPCDLLPRLNIPHPGREGWDGLVYCGGY